MAALLLKVLLAVWPFFLPVNAQASGSGYTTRYWDCCKPSCAWPGNFPLAAGSNPAVRSCDINNNPLPGFIDQSACNGGPAYMCGNESPWAVSEDLAYGTAAVNIVGGTEASWCCACYELTFTSGPVSGKKMIVQATNTGAIGLNQFDLAIPGGGFGQFDACTKAYGVPSTGWGMQYGGISDRSQCDAFPAALKAGCYWRFDWFQGSDNPSVTFTQVACPAALTAITGCIRSDDGISEQPTGGAVVVASSSSLSSAAGSGGGQSSSAAAASSSSSATVSQASTVPRWGQCGGIGYPGPTACVSGTTCQVGNPWYSQCL